jgi:hypothetical protein
MVLLGISDFQFGEVSIFLMSLNRQLTQQFITLTRNYQKLDIEDRLKWDTAAIIKYAQDKDKSLLRKNKNNLLRAATSAINELKEEITEDSQLTTEVKTVYSRRWMK